MVAGGNGGEGPRNRKKDIRNIHVHIYIYIYPYRTTTSEHFIDTVYSQFPTYSSISKVFEIHALARNQPSLDYQPVIMSIIPGTVDYQKVVLRKHRISEIDWVSLDR